MFKNLSIKFLSIYHLVITVDHDLWTSPYGVMVYVLDCVIVVREFKLQLCYYIHFQTNTLGKGMNPLIPQQLFFYKGSFGIIPKC